MTQKHGSRSQRAWTTRLKMRGKCLPMLALLVPVLVCVPGRHAGAQAGDPLMVVVNPRNMVGTVLKKADLKSILLGDKTTWSNGSQIPVILGPPGDGDRNVVLKKVGNIDEGIFTRRQMQASFSGGVPVMVREVRSASEVKAALKSSPLAVGFLHKRDVDDSVKAVFEVE